MSKRKQNVRNVNKFKGYYKEDLECRWCLYYRGKIRGCGVRVCCCKDEKQDAIANNRIKRKRGSTQWDR